MNIIGGGNIGGKAKGFFDAKEILTSDKFKNQFPNEAGLFRFPVSFCIGTNVYKEFLKQNNLVELIAKYKHSIEDDEYESLKKDFFKGSFSDSIIKELSLILEKHPFPLAVRSSSVLEDRSGTSFAGKYETVFVSNKGSLDYKINQLLSAIKKVYASTYCPNAVIYREKHHLSNQEEKMAILLQEAIGREFEGLYFPLMAGVAFSQSGYCWNKDIKKEDGLVRLVFGLGTRAVGRGYARIFSPTKPLQRPEGNAAKDIDKFSQATMDVLDLEKNELTSIHFSKVVRNGIDCYPRSERLFSLRGDNHIYLPVTNLWNSTHKPLLTFDAVLTKPWCGLDLPNVIKLVFNTLEKECSYPVDVEFAVRCDDSTQEAHFYLLQARPLSQRSNMKAHAIPKKIPEKDILFSAKRNVPSALVKNIEYIVYVSSSAYEKVPISKRYEVARVVGKINRKLEDKKFILMGPGRWGSQNVELGVPTKYSEISNCRILVEVARSTGNYVPEVSFGTHFFQDLIEDKIIYMPLYPDDPGVIFNEKLLKQNNCLRKIISHDYYKDYESLIYVAHIPSISNGKMARAVLNGEIEQGLVYLK